MRFVKFTQTNNFGYRESSISDYKYRMLGDFLISEVNSNPEAYKSWALDPNDTYTCGNIIFLDKVASDIVISYDPVMNSSDEQVDQSSCLRAEDTLALSCDNFINIIDEWMKFQRMAFKEIWIKNEAGIFWVEGVK